MWSTFIRSRSRRVLPCPSQDADYWLFFYKDYGLDGMVRCFFVPALF
jgi:hypothetical protein